MKDLPSTTVATEKMLEQSRKGSILPLVGESKNMINVLIAHEDEAKRKAIVKEEDTKEHPRIGTLQLLDLVQFAEDRCGGGSKELIVSEILQEWEEGKSID
ncbi:hypothetical protein AAC387_Pa07g2237 [Persea americana]